jgi:hypothetical protein
LAIVSHVKFSSLNERINLISSELKLYLRQIEKKTEIGISGCSDGRKRWVKVFTQVLRANMKSLCCNIEFTSNDGNTKKYASDFILIENGQMNLDYNSLFIEIFGEDFERISHLEDAKKLLQFIFKYSNTSLPGIALHF